MNKTVRPRNGQAYGLPNSGRNSRAIFKIGLMVAAAIPTSVVAQEITVQTEADQVDGAHDKAVASSKHDAPTAAKLDLAAKTVSSNPFNLTVDVGAEYSDNIFATRNDKVDDVLISVSPSADITVGDQKNRLIFFGSGELGRYIDNKSEDYDDWQLGLDARSQLSPSVTLVAGGDYRWEHESRASPECLTEN